MNKPISWNELWMNLAFMVSQRSKDPNTQCGCILVSPDNTEIALGYNGFARNIDDTEKRWQRPEKYDRVIHSEANAILNAKKPIIGWSAFITMIPCHQCASLLVQSGIKKVYYKNEPKNPDAFKYDLAKEILKEGKVELIKHESN